MEPLKINISVPFRVDGNEADHPCCMHHGFDATHVRRYLDALETEIAAASEDAKGLQVTEVEFGTGSFTHLGIQDPARVLRAIKKSFSVHPKVKITLRATPSGLNFFLLMAVKQLGNASVLMEVPALDDGAMQRAGFRCGVRGALEAMDSCFQNGFRAYGVLVSPRYCETAEVLAATLLQICARKPERICFDEVPQGALAEAAAETLTAAGFHAGRSGAAWFAGEPVPGRHFDQQIGCGPAAVSVFDGQAVQTTADFDFYCDHSGDFEALVNHG